MSIPRAAEIGKKIGVEEFPEPITAPIIQPIPVREPVPVRR